MDINGLIIRSVDYGDKDKIVTIAAPDGIYTAKAKGVRTAKSKLKGYVGILNFGEFSLAEGKGGYTLSGADVTESFYSCWTDADKYAAAMICLELYEKCSRPGAPSDLIELLKGLKYINYGEFYPFAEALRYGVVTAAESGVDVTEKVFPDKICGVFSSRLKCDSADVVLTEYTREDVKLFLKHLYRGFYSELGVKITVASQL